nr:MAG TPA: zinc finger domain-containing protein [Caudoviricetes sp.]
MFIQCIEYKRENYFFGLSLFIVVHRVTSKCAVSGAVSPAHSQ